VVVVAQEFEQVEVRHASTITCVPGCVRASKRCCERCWSWQIQPSIFPLAVTCSDSCQNPAISLLN